MNYHVFMYFNIYILIQPVRPLSTVSFSRVLPPQIKIARNVFLTGVERKKLIDESQVAVTPIEFARVSTRSYLLITGNPAYYVWYNICMCQ